MQEPLSDSGSSREEAGKGEVQITEFIPKIGKRNLNLCSNADERLSS